ncbi:MAG: response regulator [Myxococcota bacterium]
MNAGRRILIVDDNVDLAENLSEIVQDAGYQADVFGDPRAALQAMAPGRYAMAVLDLRMPHMDGVELYRELVKVDPALPAIAMTAYARDDRMEAAVQAGMTAVVSKPVELATMLGRLRAMVDGRRALVVEDEPHLAQNLLEMLADHGFSGRAAHSCAQALTLAQSAEPSILLVDLKLPDGNGLDLLRRLQPHSHGCIKLLFSGYATDLANPEAVAAEQGAHFMEKPLDFRKMLALLGGS